MCLDLFNYLLVEAHLGRFQFGTLSGKGVTNIHVQVFYVDIRSHCLGMERFYVLSRIAGL